MCDQGLPLGMDTTSRRTGQDGRMGTHGERERESEQEGSSQVRTGGRQVGSLVVCHPRWSTE